MNEVGKFLIADTPPTTPSQNQNNSCFAVSKLLPNLFVLILSKIFGIPFGLWKSNSLSNENPQENFTVIYFSFLKSSVLIIFGYNCFSLHIPIVISCNFLTQGLLSNGYKVSKNHFLHNFSILLILQHQFICTFITSYPTFFTSEYSFTIV